MGFFLSCLGMGLCLTALRAARTLLLRKLSESVVEQFLSQLIYHLMKESTQALQRYSENGSSH